MKKFAFLIIMLLGTYFLSSINAQQRIEQEGIRTSDSSHYPVLRDQRTPNDFVSEFVIGYTVPYAPQPPANLLTTIEAVTSYLINYLSFYALNDTAVQRQLERFNSEILITGAYNLTIIDIENKLVSQFFVTINLLASGMHQPIIRFVFPHRRYRQ